jgi:transmembrane sensor
MAESPLTRIAAHHVNPRWTPQREREVRERVEQKVSGKRTSRVVWTMVVAVVLAVVGVGGVRRLLESEPSVAGGSDSAKDAGAVVLALEDGSKVRRASPEARVTPLEVGPTTTILRLDQGEAHFDVVKKDRQFKVLAPGVTVTVLGTAFSVGTSPAGVRVVVERGRVEVACWDRRTTLTAGDRQLCPPSAPEAETATVAPGPSAVSATQNSTAPRPRAPTSWRAFAEEGDYAGAYARMLAEGTGAVRDEPADLLFAADVARLSGHSNEAVARLERVLRGHSGDSRAPLAAFTPGRTLLDELGRPREAAEAFAKVRRLAPGGAMAQDALAREVESWSRAGEADLARKRANQYLERYPAGRRIKAVRYHGGLE